MPSDEATRRKGVSPSSLIDAEKQPFNFSFQLHTPKPRARVPKKLLAVSLIFALFLSVLPFIPPPPPIPPPIPPSPIIPPDYPILPPIEHPVSIWVNVLIAGDEEFDSMIYEIPEGGLEGRRYAELQIRRATIWLAKDFEMELVVRGYTTWDSDDSLTGVDLFYEAVSETGFYSGMYFNQCQIDVLVAFTGQDFGYGGLANNVTSAVIIQPIVYWADDNLVQHEVSHIFGALDGTYEAWYLGERECYMKDCVMSYRMVYVETVEEDGEVYEVDTEVGQGYLTNNWCTGCYEVVNAFKYRYAWYYGGTDC